ncbi:MAG: ABC-type transport auxiliary lipoprotein family protein [Alphaproteobacteria bacterium]|nr:ABC-type transport auxiliary lipoprotein family protein [Alphaproteobacteria bacterium]MDP6874984.1 ABC-type transport auxiliary lipoprotein family protein [Alphaproteobacteria bacterium]
MTKLKRSWLVWIFTLPLALGLLGCDSLLPSLGGPPPNLYTLTPKSTFAKGLPRADWQLVVEEPVASGGLNIDRIAMRASPTELKYFARARWTERAPRMFQTLLVESFENSGAIIAVGRKAIGLRSDYNLKTEMREFQAEYFAADGIPTARVRLNAKLVKLPQRAIIASKTFEATMKSEGKGMRQVIQAFDAALGKVLRHTVEWTLTTPPKG